MTEKELRDSGKLYKPFGCEELRAEYVRAGKLVFKLNSLPPSGSEERRAVMHSLFGSMGKKCTIIPSFHCDLGYNIHIGDNFFANTGLVILDTAPVNIGNNVLIGRQVGIYAAYHPLDVATRIAGYEAAKPVTICDDVWIGGHVSILPGVTIGRGAVIGAGSVVTHSIPPGVVAAGNPCRIIKKPASAHNTGKPENE